MLENFYVIATLCALIAALFAYAIFVPRSTNVFKPELKDNKDTKAIRMLSKLGTELYATLPAMYRKQNKKPNARVEALIMRAGDPWGMTADEFVFFQFVTAFFGALVGTGVYFLISPVMSIPFYIVIGIGALFGFLYPRMTYKDKAKRRDLDFKRQLPEALDLIIISLTGGTSFINALKDSMPQIQEGVLKEEFKSIINSVDTGRTLTEALYNFADRAPNESVRTFVTALREATELNVPMVEVLESRSEASRQEFFSLLHNKTAQLPSKMMAVLVPTLMPALMLILIVPSIATLLEMM